MKTETKAYNILEPGALIEFFRGGAWQNGKVVAAHLAPLRGRRTGLLAPGRVSYDVETSPMFHPLRCAAKNVRVRS